MSDDSATVDHETLKYDTLNRAQIEECVWGRWISWLLWPTRTEQADGWKPDASAAPI